MPSKSAAHSKSRGKYPAAKDRHLPPEQNAPTPAPDETATERRGLTIFLRQTRAFRLALALYNDPVARDAEIRSLHNDLAAQGVRVLTLDLREPTGDGRSLLVRVEDLVKDAAVPSGERLAVMVVNLESRVDYSPELAQPGGPGTAFLEMANLHRELFPEVCPGPLVIWMTELLERAFVDHAPDLWHWRSHVFDLRTRAVASELITSADRQTLPSHDFRRHPEDRLRRLEEELIAYRKAGMLQDECRILNTMGWARLESGETKVARQDFEKAVSIARQIGSQQNESDALGNLGVAHRELGNTHEAIDLFKQQRVIATEIGDRYGESSALGNLGNSYLDLGEPLQAIDFYERHQIIAHELGNKHSEGEGWTSMGLACVELGDVNRAIELYEQSLAIVQGVGDRRGEGTALGNLGNAYARLGDVQKALEFYSRQLAIARETGDRRGEGNALWNSAVDLQKSGEREEAIARAEAALAIFKAIESPRAATVRSCLALWLGRKI